MPSDFDEWADGMVEAGVDDRAMLRKAFEAGRVGLIRGFCCWCEKTVPPETGGLNNGDLYCDEHRT